MTEISEGSGGCGRRTGRREVAELLLMTLVFVAPPIAAQVSSIIRGGASAESVRASYPPPVFTLAALSLTLFLTRRAAFPASRLWSEWRRAPWVQCVARANVCFGILCVGAGVVTLLAGLSGFKEAAQILPPEGVFGWANFIAGTPCAAFTEEFVYRLYLPERLRSISRRGSPALPRPAAEAVALALFSLGHIRFGWPGVLNAVVGGTALRLCVVRTRSLAVAALVHAAYNFCTFALLWLA